MVITLSFLWYAPHEIHHWLPKPEDKIQTQCFLSHFLICCLFFVSFNPLLHLPHLLYSTITLQNVCFFCSSGALYYFWCTWLSYLELSLYRISLFPFCLSHSLDLISVEIFLSLKNPFLIPAPKTRWGILALCSHISLYFCITAFGSTVL